MVVDWLFENSVAKTAVTVKKPQPKALSQGRRLALRWEAQSIGIVTDDLALCFSNSIQRLAKVVILGCVTRLCVQVASIAIC